MQIVWMLKDKKEVMLLYFCQTRSQEQSSPVLQWITKIKNPPPMQAHLSLTVSNNYFYPAQVTLKNFQPKVGK